MLSGGEVATLLGALLTPIVAAFTGLFLWTKAQAEGRIRDKDAEIARQQADHTGEMERAQADHEREVARLLEDRDRAYRERDRFIDLAVEGAETTRAAQDTAQRVTAIVEQRAGRAR